jgi:anti-sigma factor RsiW
MLLLCLQGSSTVLANLNLTPRQAMDRYSQHVQHCSHCKAALAKTQAVAAAALAAAIAALAAACLAASVRATAALSPDAVPGWLLGVVSAGGQVVGLAGPLLLLGLVAAGVHVAAKKLEQLFYYREFTRPAF